MIIRTVPFLTLLVCALAQATPSLQWLDEHAADVRRQAIEHNIPGYAFVYLEKGKPARIYTFGQTRRGGENISDATVFRLASVSKTFTAMLMAKMVSKRKLDWQTSISTLAPEYGFSHAGLDGLNLSHLIGQSSGFMPNAYDNLIDANYSVKRVLNKLAELDPLCAPGRCYTYQNTLFGVLEHYFKSQQSSYRQELTQQIIQPLAMPSASVGKAELESSASWAKPHIAMTRKSWREGRVRNNYYRFSPAAGVNASIRDMEIWVRAMLGEYPYLIHPDEVDYLTQPIVKTSREMHRRSWQPFLEDAHYGLGWRVYNFAGHKLNYHGGWVMGYRADVAFAPDLDVGYAMLMNAESNLINGFTAEFWGRLIAEVERQRHTAGLNEQVGE